MLEPLPLSSILAPLGLLLVVLFFVTSSDSGSLVIDTITAGGKLDAPMAQRVFCGQSPRAWSRSCCCSAAGWQPFRQVPSPPASPSRSCCC